MTPAPPLAPLSVLSDTQIFTAMVGSENSERADRRGINLNVQHKRSMKTMADFKLRSGVMPIRHMDTSDVAEIKHEKTIKKANFNQESKALALASNRNFPPHLLLASLLEELCFIYVKDRNKAQHLFKILCERLSNLQVMAPLSHLDEMSGLRYQRRIMLNKLIRAAMKSMEQGPSLLALPGADFSLNLDGLCVKDEDIIEQQTSRYKNEFQELCLLGKGGFGSVFKARNYLDGREYAVKKVRFKHKNTDLELKLLREVKALATLQHTNIVGYNAAWMEYDSPYLAGKESSSRGSPRTQDSSGDTADSYPHSLQFDNQDSMSIEFCLTDDKNKSEVKELPHQAQPGGFGLAMNAKLFSTVHRHDLMLVSGYVDSSYTGSSHTHLNENHNRSTELESTQLGESVQKHTHVHKSPSDTETVLVKGEVSKTVMVMEELSSHDTKFFQSGYEEDEIVTHFEGEFKISAETHKDTSTTVFCSNPAKSSQAANKGILSNPSTNVQDLHFSFGNTHNNQNPVLCITNDDELSVRIDSTGFAVTQKSSSTMTTAPVVDQINVNHMSQAHLHNHHCPSCTKCTKRQNSLDQSSGVKLPADFICLCQQAASSHFSGLNPDHPHLENLSVSPSSSDSSLEEQASLNFRRNSQRSAVHLHSILDTASQRQSDQPGSSLFQIPTSSFLTSERDTVSSYHNEPSGHFDSLHIPAPKASFCSKFTGSGSHYNNAVTLNEDRKPFIEKDCVPSSVLTPVLSLGQSRDKKNETKPPALKIFIPNAGSNEEPFKKVSEAVSTSVGLGSRKTALKRSLIINPKNDSTSDVEESHVHSNVFQNSITLYIQMELCTFTLQEWMFERNSEFQMKGCDDAAMRSDNIRIFYQILQGVDFIHTDGIIHRDLKPRNIFLSGSDLHVKIGDFGLATRDALRPGQDDFVLTPLSAVTPLVFDSHTTGVGTSAYASPEQLKGSNYDFKSDMYSLGVMLYEMFHVFTTEMERVQEIQQLRGGNKCCAAFRKKWSLEADTVEALTNPIASKRPSAQDVLSSRLFLSLEQQIKMLKRKLLEKEKEMERMQRELIEKDKIIAQLRRDRRDKIFTGDLGFV